MFKSDNINTLELVGYKYKQSVDFDEIKSLWSSLPPSLRRQLLASEFSPPNTNPYDKTSHNPDDKCTSGSEGTGEEGSEGASDGTREVASEEGDEDPPSAITSFTSTFSNLPPLGTYLSPLPSAPKNIYRILPTIPSNKTNVGYRNVFNLPISYDVTIVESGSLLDSRNNTLHDVLGPPPLTNGGSVNEQRTCFLVVDSTVWGLYGTSISSYYAHYSVTPTICLLPGEESNKTEEALKIVMDAMVGYGVKRRECVVGIGGGVLLDVVGLAANCYRRGVPFVRVPTTLLSIVDASVGVKNGIDYCCPSPTSQTPKMYKNRMGSFYAPSAVVIDKGWIGTNDRRNIENGCGEIFKLAIVRSRELFDLLLTHGPLLTSTSFTSPPLIASRIITLSIEIMLSELGPNLWESKLDRCVDYGHTFSKTIEMEEGNELMHGEAVGVDGLFSAVLSYRRGRMSYENLVKAKDCMLGLGLPLTSPHLTLPVCWSAVLDALEHRNGKQCIPFVDDIGSCYFVNDLTEEEIGEGLRWMEEQKW